MRVLDLFSGIGGFSLGLRMAGGFETVQFVEIDPRCRQVLAKNFPGVPIHDDIRSFRPAQASADIVVGGFPCQPFSSASRGRARGREDDRYLWPEMRRVIQVVQPTWVIGENVTHLRGVELENVVSDMEADGFGCAILEVPACAVGFDHRRSRLWIFGHAHRNGESSVPVNAKASGLSWTRGESRGLGGPHGIPRRVDRLRGLGNAVVPQVVAEIGKAIRRAA